MTKRLAGPAVLLAGTWTAMWKLAPFSDTRITDVFIYMHDAGLVVAGVAPYSGAFPFEYPPLALGPIWSARALGGDYETTFGILMAICALGTLVVVAALAGTRAAWLFALTPLAAGAVLRTHFDLFAALVLVGALLAFERRRPLAGFALLGVGTMVKGFPVVILPIAFAWCWARGERAAAWRGLALFAAISLAVSAPFLGSGYWDAYTFHVRRPVQIESTPAVVLYGLGGSHVTGTATVADAFHSNGLRGGAANVVQALFGVVAVLVLALLAWLATRSAEPRQLTLCAIGAVLAFVALGKVLSPQYVAWLAPLAALLLAWRERIAGLLLAAAVVLTQLEFPSRYAELVNGHTGVRLIVAARDLALVAALIATARAAARWSPPAVAPSSAPAHP